MSTHDSTKGMLRPGAFGASDDSVASDTTGTPGGAGDRGAQNVPIDFGTVLAEGFARRMGVLAERLGADPVSARWARRAAFAVSRATSAGHVCVSLARLAHRYGETLANARAALRASGLVFEVPNVPLKNAMADEAALRPLVVDADHRLYLARYFDYERRLATAIVEHAVAAPAPNNGITLHGRLARYFGPPSGDDVDWQRAAAALALAGRLTVVSGGPGTGKTTTVVGMLACLIDAQPTLSVALAAPTGKAAQRMQEALLARAATLPADIAARLPRTSQTLHRLLGIAQGTRARYHRDNPLPYDVLVVDEASMIDLAMAAQLFDALSPDSRLVLLGDKDQLAAVEAGAVFAELSARPAFSPAGIARIAQATGVDEARVAAALPRGRDDDAASKGLAASEFDVLDDEADLPGFDEFHDWPMEYDDRAGLEEAPHDAALGDEASPAAASAGAVTPTVTSETASAAPLVDCVIWLERNYRFGLDSSIGRVSLAIRRGDVQAALDALEYDDDGSASAVLDEDAGAALASRTVERLAQGFAPYASALAAALAERVPNPVPLFDALNAFRILCATRTGARGVDALNVLMAAHVRRAAGVTLGVGASWFAGRPVMIARND
ncbi:MAG TPA: AAA family ATPase, partial [Trinickia sp.]|nr:AAA family ATPase [Trinickia sp.]